ncbi:MAG: chromophore lyase CpcT/CpeT [Candidatus Zixiibacteriota bacterium]
MRTMLSLLFCSLLLAGSIPQAQESEDFRLEQLVEWMTGSFSSREQSLADSNFYDIRLHMVPIWPDREDGAWLYVEQAAATNLDEPYRQRIYHLVLRYDGTFVSEVYTFEEPLRFAGAWKEPFRLNVLSPDSLTERAGCSIYLQLENETAFVGSTRDTDCESDLRGASYATSEVKITESALYSWDRGFDAEGNQVWGARTGGYIFKKIR